jgi:hypothetical protein
VVDSLRVRENVEMDDVRLTATSVGYLHGNISQERGRPARLRDHDLAYGLVVATAIDSRVVCDEQTARDARVVLDPWLLVIEEPVPDGGARAKVPVGRLGHKREEVEGIKTVRAAE